MTLVDTLETKLAAAKIVYDVGLCSAESQESLCTVQRQHNTRWHDTVLAIWRCIFHLNNLSNLRKTLKALFVPLLKFRARSVRLLSYMPAAFKLLIHNQGTRDLIPVTEFRPVYIEFAAQETVEPRTPGCEQSSNQT